MHHLAAVVGAEVLAQVVGRAAEQPGQLRSGVGAEPARDGGAGPVAQVDHGADVEDPLDRHDPGGQQRGPPAQDGPDRPRVQQEPTLRRRDVGQPQRPGRQRARRGLEPGADVQSGHRLGEPGGRGDQRGDRGVGGDGRGVHLGAHPARADRATGAAEVRLQPRCGRHEGDPAGPRAGRRPVVQPVHVGEQHQRARPDQVRHEGREPVVVAEADLVGGHGVVLVDHRHRAQADEAGQRGSGVQVVVAPDQVVQVEQHLPHHQVVPGERGGPARHQPPLADAGRGLQAGEVRRAPRHPEQGQTGGDGPRGHHHQPAVLPQRPTGGEPVDETVHGPLVDPGRRGQAGGAHLDHQRAGTLEQRVQARPRQPDVARRAHSCSAGGTGSSAPSAGATH